MRAWIALILLPLAGCVTEESGPGPIEGGVADLELYVFWMEEGARQNNEESADYMARVTNHGLENVTYSFYPGGVEAHYGAMGSSLALGFHSPDHPSQNDTLAPGESRLWIVQSGGRYFAHDFTISLMVGGEVVASKTIDIPDGGGQAVSVRDNVQTITIGVWTNGTVFYTNSRALLEDPNAPLGGHIDYEEALAGTDPLPVYVYLGDRTDQPPSSRDNCYFTTIAGYNSMLIQSMQGVTQVGLMTPDKAYTLPGNEAHFLYGESLIFLNVVIAVDGNADVTDGPDPDGACFSEQNTIDYVSERAPF